MMPMRSLRRQLTLSHSKPAVFALIGLVLAIAFVSAIYRYSDRLAKVRLPNALSANQLKLAVAESRSLLKTWVLVSDPDSKVERRRVWREEIEPLAAQLVNSYASGYADPGMGEDATRLQRLLVRLKDSQWWVEDISTHIGNTPSRTIYDQQIIPMYYELYRAVNGLLYHPLPGQDADQVKLEVLQTHRYLSDTLRGLTEAVMTGAAGDAEAFSYGARATEDQFLRLRQLSPDRDGVQALLDWLLQEHRQYNHLANKAISHRQSDQWNSGLFLLRTSNQPIVAQVNGILDDIVAYENRKLSQSAKQLADWLLAFIIFGALLVVMALVCAVAIARMAANYYVFRLTQLSRAATALAEDDDHRLDVVGSDEIADLMKVFNDMKAAIKDREDKLVQQQEDLNQLTRVVTHDMKPPIINIRGHAEIISESTKPFTNGDASAKTEEARAAIRDSVGYIDKSVARLGELINGILSFSKLSNRDLSIEMADTGDIVKQIIDINSHRLSEAELDIAGNMPVLNADRFVLKFLFSTLIDNAIDYRAQGRRLKISIGHQLVDGDHRFWVRDNGVGVSEEAQSTLFALSGDSTGRPGHYGVGLASAKMLLQRLGGRIWHQRNESGQPGASFFFQLPNSG